MRRNMNRVTLLLKLARAFRRAQDGTENNPKRWITMNGAHVPVDENGNCAGGAGGKLNGMPLTKSAKNKNSGSGNKATASVESEIFVKELPRVNGRRQFLVNGRKYTQIKLSWEAYAGVMSEIDTWMTKERRQKRRFFQHILNYTYDIIIVDDETNDIVIVGQKRIK